MVFTQFLHVLLKPFNLAVMAVFLSAGVENAIPISVLLYRIMIVIIGVGAKPIRVLCLTVTIQTHLRLHLSCSSALCHQW